MWIPFFLAKCSGNVVIFAQNAAFSAKVILFKVKILLREVGNTQREELLV